MPFNPNRNKAGLAPRRRPGVGSDAQSDVIPAAGQVPAAKSEQAVNSAQAVNPKQTPSSSRPPRQRSEAAQRPAGGQPNKIAVPGLPAHPRRSRTGGGANAKPTAPTTQPRQPQSQTQSPAQPAGSQTRRRNPNQAQSQRPSNSVPSLRIIPLGGMREIGKNLTVYEYGNDMIIVDCGLAFPEEDMPGIDVVIPDFTYILKKQRQAARHLPDPWS